MRVDFSEEAVRLVEEVQSVRLQHEQVKAAAYAQLADCKGEWFPVDALRAYEPNGPDQLPVMHEDRITETVIRYVQRLTVQTLGASLPSLADD